MENIISKMLNKIVKEYIDKIGEIKKDNYNQDLDYIICDLLDVIDILEEVDKNITEKAELFLKRKLKIEV